MGVCNGLRLELGALIAAGGRRGGRRSLVTEGQCVCSDEPVPGNSVKNFHSVFFLLKNWYLFFLYKARRPLLDG